jgi:hypothetical protein
MLHDGLRWDCLWGENLLVEPKGAQTMELSVAGDALSWTWNARRLHADLPPATADALRSPRWRSAAAR